MNSQLRGEAVFRGAALALIAAALGSGGIAFVGGFAGRIDSQTVALIALASATFACVATIGYFLYFVLRTRRQMKL
jgi:hypothetical protein